MASRYLDMDLHRTCIRSFPSWSRRSAKLTKPREGRCLKLGTHAGFFRNVLTLPRGPGNKTTALTFLAFLVLASAFLPFAHAQPTVVATVKVGATPYGIAYDSGKGEVFVANVNGNTTSVISDDTNAVVATIQTGDRPEGVAYDSVKGEVFVADQGSNTVSVISDGSNKVVANVTVGRSPFSVAYDHAMDEIIRSQ